MIKSLNSGEMYKYPYTEGDDNIRKKLLEYIEQEGFINTEPYNYDDIDDKGLSVHNITFLPYLQEGAGRSPLFIYPFFK